MQATSLTELVEQQLAQAGRARGGRAAHTVHGGHEHELRQTVLALAAGRELAEHESPGEATLQVLHAVCGSARTAMPGKADPETSSPFRRNGTR